MVLIDSVVLLEGNSNYTTVYLDNGKSKTIARSIKFFEPFLKTHGFLRVHRSFLINPTHVKDYNSVDYILTMSNGQKANIARRRKHTAHNFMGVIMS